MEDRQLVVVCAVAGVIALVCALAVPPSVQKEDLRIEGTVVSAVHPAGLTIASVRLRSPVSVVFMRGANVSAGEVVQVNASLERYQGKLELIVR